MAKQELVRFVPNAEIPSTSPSTNPFSLFLGGDGMDEMGMSEHVAD